MSGTAASDQEGGLLLTAEENYAHARDHEHLRAQVTSILVAASFVLIGLALDNGAQANRLYFAAVAAIALSFLNIMVVVAHTNRFQRHVEIARSAKRQLQHHVVADATTPKMYSLSTLWVAIAASPGIAGLALAICERAGVFVP